MISRRAILAAAALAAISGPAFAQAAGAPAIAKQKFTEAAFDAANKAGKPIFIEIHAPWCPTCKQQAPHISKFLSEPRFKGLTVFSVDFDSQKDALKKLNAQKQSTLIVFKGGKEMERSVGDTDGQTIKMLLETAL